MRLTCLVFLTRSPLLVLDAGDKVLVHAAAGGVGHAAISICKHFGAEIYATCSAGKRAVVEALGVQPDHIFDSRSTSWFAELMKATNGVGVKLLLNSLAGKHQWLGVQALAPCGHFLEIGKMDIYANSKIGLMMLRKNASFHAIDMDRMALEDPVGSSELTAEVWGLIVKGAYEPLPITVLPMNRMHDAIDLMKSGTHIGKIVLTNYHEDGTPVEVEAVGASSIYRPDGTYIITGAAGGFGGKLLRHAYVRGARHFVVTVSQGPERIANMFPYMLSDPEVTLEVVVADVSKDEDVAKVVAVAKAQKHPLRTVFHVAGITVNVGLNDVTSKHFEENMGSKGMGAWYLHQHTRDIETVENFVIVGSISSTSGGRGIVAYGSVHGFTDALIRMRRAEGLPGTTFGMASLSDVGILAQDIRSRHLQMAAKIKFVMSDRALKDMDDQIMCGVPVAAEVRNTSILGPIPPPVTPPSDTTPFLGPTRQP